MERGSHSDFLLRNLAGITIAALILAGTIVVPLNAQAALPGACNCVILRLDDIQDWWLNSVQNAVLDEFVERDEKVSLGIVMNFVGNDPSVVDKVRAGHVSGNFELASHAWNHVDHQGLTLPQQQDTLALANDKMQSLWGRSSYIFIPPYNSFNTDTLQALQDLDMKLISSEFDNLAPFVQPNQVFKSQTGSDIKDSFGLYELPQTVGYWNYEGEMPVKNSLNLIMDEVTSRINSHGYAVVTLHPQDFAVKVNDVPTNQADPNEIADLNTLIDLIHNAGFTINSYSEVTNIPLPPIVDNTAPVMTPPPDKTYPTSQALTQPSEFGGFGTPSVTDNVDPSPTVTNNAPPAGFPQGTTAVVWNATDDSGNSRLATQYVTIRPTADNVKPSIATTAPPSGSISGPASGLNLPVTGTASDAQTGLKTVEVRTGSTAYKTATQTSPGSWSNWSTVLRFTSSTSTTIVARATDFWGNQQWYNTPLTITLSGPDTEPPQLTVPPDVFTEATSAETAVYIGMATAFDNSDPTPVITSDNPGSGEAAGFPVGTTIITWMVEDAAGNTATATQSVTVVDTTAPGTPELLLPTSGSQLASGTVNFDWDDVADAVSSVAYDLLVADNPEFSNPAIEQTGLVQSNYTATVPLQSGTHYWKARSADESGNQSPYSDTDTFTIDNSAPSATASPPGGAYSTAQSVTLAASEPATIYYTTDGSTPTTASTVYSNPIDILGDTPLKFFAVDTAGNAGSVVTEIYDIDTTAPTVNASPAGGVYNTPQSVTLTASEPATIYYTTDGSIPTTASTVYANPIPVTDTSDLKFFAVDSVGNTGLINTESYIFDVTAPTVTATPGSGVYNTPQSVTLTASEPSSNIYYTTDGSTPTTASTIYPGPIEISVNTDLKFFAVDSVGNTGSVVTKTYSFDTTAPSVTAAPPGGTYNTPQSVALTADEQATIYYTTDDTDPTTSSAVYSDPIAISNTTDLKFFAIDVAGNAGLTVTENYNIDTVAPTVTAAPPGGIYNAPQSVTLSPDEAANIYYTTDGSTPTTASTIYSGPIPIPSDTELRFFAVDLAGNAGAIVTEDYTIDTVPPTVTASPTGGVYNTPQSVTLTPSEPATIYYTIDGSDPTTASPVYSGPIDISTDTSLKFFAIDLAGNAGSVKTRNYIFDTAAPTVIASPPGGTYGTTQLVTLTPSESATIYYTTDGSTPTTASTIYPGPIEISVNTDLKFLAVDVAGNQGATVTETYTFDMTAPTTMASPPGGLYNTTQSVTLTASEPATIYYTTDGSTPTTASAVYADPISITDTSDLKFFAVDMVGNTGSTATENYVIDITAPTATATPGGGIYALAQSVTLAADEPATIYYTTDGSEPTTSSPVYESPIPIAQTADLKFFAVDLVGNSGTTVTESYIIDDVGPTVTAFPSGGTYGTSQSVTLTASEPATIYYTIDGATPTITSTVYSSPISINETTDLKFFGVDNLGNAGPVFTESYVIDTVAPVVTALPAGGLYSTTQLVTLSASEPAAIYYTTDGSTPTTSNTLYGSPISIETTADLKFFAVDTVGNAGPVSTESYVIDTELPTVTVSPPGGTYNTPQSVTLTPSEASTIYYTTDGSTPTTASTIYPGPIEISVNTDLKFFAVDTAGNEGLIVAETYTFDTTAPIVTASPPGGTYNASQSVSLAASEPATIYYTTDGSIPTTASTAYSDPIPISVDTDLKFFGVDNLDNEGTVVTELYIIDVVLPTAAADPSGGTYSSTQSVTLTASEPATIYYTTDGSDPTMASTVYESPISITQTADLKFFAVDLAGNTGTTITESYIIDSAGPTVSASPLGGIYNATQSVTLTASEPATIYYTTDGSTPTTSSAVYASPISIAITSDLKFFAVDSLGNVGSMSTEAYVIDIVAPTASASPAGGTYSVEQSVALSASESATIYYTLDGSTPTAASTVYSSPLNIAADTTLKFFATDQAGNSGPVMTETYNIDSSAPTVSASPPGGTYNAAQSVTLTPSESATIYYTTDGSTPTTSSAVYSSPIAISVNTELKFFGVDSVGNTGLVVTEAYVIDTAGPTVTASPEGDLYNSAQSVSLVASEPGSTVYYTTDGATPTTSSTIYSDPISIIATTDLQFFGVDNLGNAGPLSIESYIIDTESPTVAASPSGGTYSTPQSVTLAASEPNSTIYYTTDGSEPTTGSITYATPISITSTTDLKFFAVDQAGNQGPVTTESYVVDVTGPTVTASPPGGIYNSAQSVTLTASELGSTIYYTLDGSEPTTASAVYSDPISISETADLKFFAVDSLGNTGPVITENYIIDTVAPTATASPVGAVYGTSQSVTLAASEPGATIYFTTDGSTPTTASTAYSSPLNISEDTTLKFFATDLAGNNGSVVTETYIIDASGPTVTASPAGGLYNTAQSVILTASEPATIYYTTDGSDPTTSSTVYSSPISIAATTELKFFGTDSQGNDGSTITESYVIDTVAPTATAAPAGGVYNTSQSVVLTPSESATIYYTTDGTAPTTSSPVYASPIPIAASATLMFFAVDAAGNTGSTVTENYTIDTVAPSASAAPPGGTYTSAQSVALSASEPATVYYATDGSAPTTSSSVYSSPINISATTTLKFLAVDAAGNAGTVTTELYTIESTTFPVTHMSDTTATFGLATHSAQQAHVEFASPTSQLVGKSIDEITLKLRKTGSLSGQAQIGVFNADLTVKKEFGTITANTITSTYSDYTFSLPNNELYTIESGDRIGIKYSGGNAANFIAVMLDQDPADPYDGSNTYRQQYTTSWASSTPNDLYMILRQTHGSVDTIPPTVTAFPAGGPYTEAQSVTLSSDEPATIYYTLDGSEPTTSSTAYSSPIDISETTTLKFFGVDSADNTGAVGTEIYTIQPVSFPVTHMSDTTATFGLATHSAQQAHVEFVSPTSELVGKSIDEITLKLRKSGAPTGTIEVGVFNSDLTVKKSFGTMSVSAIASGYTDYTFSLTNNELYTIEANDRIGIKYSEGNTSNFVAVMIDRNSADPFDGSNTYRQQYTTSWSNYPLDDMYMILKQTHT